MQYLILAALVIAGLIVGVDAIRERASRRKALHVPGSSRPPCGRGATHGHPSRPGSGAGGRSDDRGGRTRAVGRARGDARPRDVRAEAGGGTEIKTLLDALGQRLRDRRPPGPRPALRAPTVGSDAHGAMDGTRTTPGADRRSPPGRAGDLDPAAVLGLIVALREGGFLDPARPDVQALVQTHLDRASAGRRKLRDFAQEPEDLLGGRRAIRRGRATTAGSAVLPPGRGGARLARRAGRPRRVHRRAAIGALSAVDRRRAGRDADLPRPRAVPAPSRTSSATRWR